MNKSSKSVHYVQVTAGKSSYIESEIAIEKAVNLSVNGQSWITFMCTPIYLDELAIGFLFNEGIIEDINDIASIRCCPSKDNIDIWLNHWVDLPKEWRRTSGCSGGLTSVVNTAEDENPSFSVNNGITYTPAQLHNLGAQLLESQEIYSLSGGVHASALSDGYNLSLIAEDIGRHNTIDKIAGMMIKNHISYPNRILLSTGRISSEMLQKSFRMNVKVIISRTSPTSLSIELAEIWGLTLIGYARRNSFRVYTHPERIRDLTAETVAQ